MKEIIEHTYGTHIYMKMKLDNGRIEEIDVYLTDKGIKYVTSSDHRIELRNEIIEAFEKLY